MIIYKAYKFRLYPEEEQKNKLNQFLGTSRFIYNLFLGRKDEKYKDGINYKKFDMIKDLVPLQSEYSWLSDQVIYLIPDIFISLLLYLMN